MSTKKSNNSDEKKTVSCSFTLELDDPDPIVREAAYAIRNGYNVSTDGGIIWLKGKQLALYALGELMKSRREVQKTVIEAKEKPIKKKDIFNVLNNKKMTDSMGFEENP